MPDQPPQPALLRAIDGAGRACAAVAAAGLGCLVLTVAADVAGRTLLGRPLTGALEMTAHWWMPVLTLLAMAMAERQGEHIRVTLLIDTLPDRMRAAAEAAFALVAAALLVLVARHALAEAMQGAAIGRSTPSNPPVAIWPFAFVAVAGLLMLALQNVATAWRRLAGLPDR